MTSNPQEVEESEEELQGPYWIVYHPFFVWLRSKPQNLRWGVVRWCVFFAIGIPLTAIIGGGAVLAGLSILTLYALAFIYGLSRL